MNKSEAKFHNTAVKMHEALFRILERKEFSDISVMEICKEAGVNRSTFYAHYENTHDLLTEARDRLVDSFFGAFNGEGEDWKKPNINPAEEFISPKYLIPYLEFVRKYKREFKVFMTHLSTFSSNDIYEVLFEQLWLPSCASHNITDKTVINYMARYYLQGIMSIIMEWINRSCEDDILFICEVIILCVKQK